VPVGFLDHTDGGSAFALVAPALAVGYGADLVEKHFTLDRSEKGFDYQSSLNPEDFYRMVELLRQAERAAGDGPAAESEGSKRYHRVMARSIVAGKLIPRGEVLTREMLAFKRTDVRFEPGFPPRSADRVIGRRAARPIQADETIREDMLQ
jgi:sialic acid synthase SpsE